MRRFDKGGQIAVIAFTRPGKAIAGRIMDGLERKGLSCKETTYKGAGELFSEVDGYVFVGAVGIAVRALAPHIRSKYTDPAVVVVDERGGVAISMLSGHEGGANDLTREIAGIIGAEPIITTATELKTQIAGCGCRKGTTADEIESVFIEAGVWPERVVKLCTIDLKREESGLIEFGKRYEIPIEFYTAEELASVGGEFAASEFVEKITGVDNVCERAAVLGGGNRRLIEKYAKRGVTVTVYEGAKR